MKAMKNFNPLQHGTEARSSCSNPPLPLWVTHTPTLDHVTDESDDDDDDSNSTAYRFSNPPHPGKQKKCQKESMKNRLKSLFPQSLGSVIQKQTKESSKSGIQILPNGTRVSPPVSPLLENRIRNQSLRTPSNSSHKQLMRTSPTEDPFCQGLQEQSLLTSIHPAEYYAEKMELYQLRYSYLKSWPGLLRLLAGFQLLFGGVVFACVIAYIQKDSEWSNIYGHYNSVYNNGLGLSGYSYRGPMTPFILAVAGVSWIITLCLLVIGMTMYYHTILLNSSWWPLTEAFINMALFLLYMAAGIVYLNDLNRGGLCLMTIGINPIMASLCRVDGGQMAGTVFIFINMATYLGSFLVCLKMWRHEAARREREYFEKKEEFHQSIPLTPPNPKHKSFKDEMDKSLNKDAYPPSPEVHKSPVTASSYIPTVHTVADYIMKYPEISCVEEREKYKAVFNDQYQEYKDLHSDITSTTSKFRELDAVMEQFLRGGKNLQDQQRIQSMLKTYQQKKKDPAFLEKKERCDYLKAKLNHIKNRINTFDQETAAKSRTRRRTQPKI